MRQLLTATLRFLLRHALQFALFIVILLAGRMLLAEWRAYSAGSEAVAALRLAANGADHHGAGLAAAATARVNALQTASQAAIAARLAQVQAQLTALRARQQPSLFTLPPARHEHPGPARARRSGAPRGDRSTDTGSPLSDGPAGGDQWRRCTPDAGAPARGPRARVCGTAK
ncbi:hypothetical protein ACPJXG_11580 [Janthinobacterium sp. NFX145]|uniref:hypothetical protein n=1 Tax=Janthinobacterium sp. NFX145 TaxID=3415602 RepID=UPI003CC6CEB5